MRIFSHFIIYEYSIITTLLLFSLTVWFSSQVKMNGKGKGNSKHKIETIILFALESSMDLNNDGDVILCDDDDRTNRCGMPSTP